MKNHTGTHVLNFALQRVLEEVNQKGRDKIYDYDTMFSTVFLKDRSLLLIECVLILQQTRG